MFNLYILYPMATICLIFFLITVKIVNPQTENTCVRLLCAQVYHAHHLHQDAIFAVLIDVTTWILLFLTRIIIYQTLFRIMLIDGEEH